LKDELTEKETTPALLIVYGTKFAFVH